MAECILCGAHLPPDRRWKLTRLLAPRCPRCWPATAACYRGLCTRIGAKPSAEHLAQVVADANRGGRRP